MTATAIRRRAVVQIAAICAAAGISAGLFAQDGSVQQPGPPVQVTGGGRQAAPPDPRVGLKAGLADAGQAAKGMELVGSVAKPEAFADPTGRGGLAFANSDLAFRGTLAFQGNFTGLSFYDIEDPRRPVLRTSIVCPGGQGDVSVYGNLLFMSVEETRGRVDCGVAPAPPPAAAPDSTAASQSGAAAVPAAGEGAPDAAPGVDQQPQAGQAAAPARGEGPGRGTGPGPGRGRGQLPPDPMRFRGVRIFDISNLAAPRQVGQVQTCRGSHTHTLVPDPKDKAHIYIYGQGTSIVRPGEELTGCVGAETDPTTALFSIDVIKVPLANPAQAAIVSRPRIFADPVSGALGGLWQGGNHGAGTQTSGMTRACHDITVFSEIGLAAGACSGNGILLDISDPVHPIRIDDVIDPSFAYWHSASFNNDGTKVLFTDEWGGGTSPRCRSTDPLTWGANAIFTLTNRRLRFGSYYKMPAPQTEQENCVAHNGSLIPVPGRDIKVQGWYQGGISIVDFTHPSQPVEIGYFDRGPIDATRLIVGGFWAAYWYNGYIYGSEMARGLDIFALVPTDLLSQNEIDAAKLVRYSEFNPQSQPRFTWPPSFTVAKAYLDQLTRTGSLAPERVTTLTAAMDALEKMPAGASRRTAAGALDTLADALEKDAVATPRAAARLRALAATIKGRTAQLRTGT
jgi:hypothetical protein